jgi:hypothetical protein
MRVFLQVERARQAAEAAAEVERAKSEAAAAQLREQRAREQALRERGADLPSHGDGGLQWRQRALKRAEEQAREAGVSLEEYAKERWGSLDALKSSIADSRTATRTPGQPASSVQSSTPVSADREHADRRAQAAVAQRMKAPHADDAVSQSPVVASDWRTKLVSSRSEHEKLVSSSTSSHTSATAQPALPQPTSAAAGQGSADAVDVNKLMARALRAKLMGDMATFERLTAEVQICVVFRLLSFQQQSSVCVLFTGRSSQIYRGCTIGVAICSDRRVRGTCRAPVARTRAVQFRSRRRQGSCRAVGQR